MAQQRSKYAGELMLQKLERQLKTLAVQKRQDVIRRAIKYQWGNVLFPGCFDGKHKPGRLALQRKYAPQTLPTEFKLIQFPGKRR